MQLTNILRDVREDGKLGRVLPALEDLRRFGVADPTTAAADALVELICFEAARDRDGSRVALPSSTFSTRAAARACWR